MKLVCAYLGIKVIESPGQLAWIALMLEGGFDQVFDVDFALCCATAAFYTHGCLSRNYPFVVEAVLRPDSPCCVVLAVMANQDAEVLATQFDLTGISRGELPIVF